MNHISVVLQQLQLLWYHLSQKCHQQPSLSGRIMGNPDYFKLDVDSGSTLTVGTKFTGSIPLYGVFSLYFESAESTISSTSISTGTSLIHSYTFNKKETVYLKMIYTNNSQTSYYSVKYAMDVRVVAPGK